MKVVLSLLFLIIIGSIGFILLEPEPEPEETSEKDTGMTRHETEELMRTIGYVQ
jgi:hypothetical protein